MLNSKIPIIAVFYLLSSFGGYHLSAQTKQASKFTFSAEVIPCVVLYGGRGDGFHVSLERRIFKEKFGILVTYGINKRSYDLSGQVEAPLVNGLPLVDKTTTSSIFTPKEERTGGVPDESLFQLLQNSGVKQYKPYDGAYITNYGTIELLRKHSFKQKWDLDWGFGMQMGLMNRNEAAGGLSDSVNYFGQPIKTWIIYRISARYLYYGFTTRLSFTRRITDHFSLGIGSGLHLIMSKGSTDDAMPYVSILAKCSI